MRPIKNRPLRRTASRALELMSRTMGAAVYGLDNARRIANFLQGRMELRVRPTDVFISSYPRSGTTLTQWILYLLSHDGEEEPAHLTQVSPWFERSLAIGELTAEDLESLPSPRVFKSHLPRQWLPDGARYIYVERDALDVLVSYYHFYRAYLGFEGTLDEFYTRFMDGRVQYGSWHAHVAEWRSHASDPDVLIVRYEDLLDDRRAAIGRMTDFLGWEVDDRVVDRAVVESSFDAMKRRESVFDHATALLLERGVRPREFLRAGQRGGGASELSEPQMRAVRERSSRVRPLAIRGLAAFLQ